MVTGEAQPPLGKYTFCRRLIEFARGLGVERVFTFAAMALLAVRLNAPTLLDLVLVGTLVGFLSTVAFARLVAARSSS